MPALSFSDVSTFSSGISMEFMSTLLFADVAAIRSPATKAKITKELNRHITPIFMDIFLPIQVSKQKFQNKYSAGSHFTFFSLLIQPLSYFLKQEMEFYSP